MEQIALVKQGPQSSPPQSMSVSVPFRNPSPQVAMRQRPDWQTFVVQSTNDTHG
jgi:hypothetical protein